MALNVNEINYFKKLLLLLDYEDLFDLKSYELTT